MPRHRFPRLSFSPSPFLPVTPSPRRPFSVSPRPRVSASALLRQHFLEVINRPRITGFTERTYRLLAHEVIRVSAGDPD